MHIKVKSKIHNRFDIEKRDATTGELKQAYFAENIILDGMYTYLCNGQAYFGAIHFGTGVGTPQPTDTSLFTFLGSKYADTEEIIKDIPVSSWKRKIVLAPEEFVGQTITEVGIAQNTNASTLVTKAMIKDSEGNPISITKTDTDVITIYATVFVTFDTSNSNLKYIGVESGANKLMNYLIGGAAAPTGTFSLLPGEGFGLKLGSTSSAAWSVDVANKKRKTNLLRFGTTIGNGNVMGLEFDNLFSLAFPSMGIHSGRQYNDVPIATGDGITTRYQLPSKNINLSSIVMKSDGVEKSNFTKEKIRKINFIFSKSQAIPSYAYGAAITPDGSKVVIGHRNSPVLSTYFLSSNYDRTTIAPDVATGDPYNIAMTPDGLVLAYVGSASPYLFTYDWNGTAWIKRNNPVDLPSMWGDGIALSDDGLILAIMGSFTGYLFTYDWNGTAWIKRPTPTHPPTSGGTELALSADGSIMAVGFTSSPYLFTYDWNGTAWIKRDNPIDVPSGKVNDISMTPDGLIMAVAHNNSPYVAVYDWNGTAWIKRANPTDLPVNHGTAISITADASLMAVGYASSPYVTLYEWSGTVWIKRGSDITFANSPNKVKLNTNGDKLVWTSSYSPYGEIYDIKARTIEVEFDAPEASGKAITSNYLVEGVHKTENQVIDVSCAIQFGEGV